MSETQELSKTIDLRDKITFGGREYTQLVLRPPKVAERRQAEGHLRINQAPANYTMYATQLVAACSDTKEGVIEQMYNDQFEEAWNWVGGFFGDGRKSGSS